MKNIWYLLLVLNMFSAHANSPIGIKNIEGTWVKPCSFDPIPGEKKPNYSEISATLENNHIDIEVNYFTDSACTSPWALMPTFLQTGKYSAAEANIEKRINGKDISVLPIKIHITHFDNNAKFKTIQNFTVYFDHFSKAYIQRRKKVQVFKRAIVEPKARVAKEVYIQKKNTQVCVISMKIASTSFSWCLENVSFPSKKFKAYCQASTPEENGDVYYTYLCPTKLKSNSCLYGLQELGHDLRRWYSKNEVKTNPLAKKACETQLHGVWK